MSVGLPVCHGVIHIFEITWITRKFLKLLDLARLLQHRSAEGFQVLREVRSRRCWARQRGAGAARSRTKHGGRTPGVRLWPRCFGGVEAIQIVLEVVLSGYRAC